MIFKYKNKNYPNYLKEGNAIQFIYPYLDKLCIGEGLDIGCGKNPYRNATPIDIDNGSGFSAYDLPSKKYDYIISSHSLEHLPDYVSALELWKSHLKPGGVLFLYLPHPDMEYWLPQNNRKHFHLFYPADISKLLSDLGFENIVYSERDLYYSFGIYAFNPEDK